MVVVVVAVATALLTRDQECYTIVEVAAEWYNLP